MNEWDEASVKYAIGIQHELGRLGQGIINAHWHVLANLLQTIWTNDLVWCDERTLLDVGCGAGHASVILPKLVGDWISYFGCEPSERMRAVGKKLCPDAGVNDMDILKVPDHAQRRWAQIVMSNGTLNHIHAWRQALAMMALLSEKYVILHRLWVYMDDSPSCGIIKQAYDQNIWHMRINQREMKRVMEREGFELKQRVSSNGSGEPLAGWTFLFERT